MEQQIAYHYENEFILRDEDKYTEWIINCLQAADYQVGDISYVFMSDDQLLEVNRQFLQHDYYTDIITFPFSEGKVLSADICISTDRVKENAQTYEVLFEEELRRVMIHGVLHLMGWKDTTDEDKVAMRDKETLLLEMFHVKH